MSLTPTLILFDIDGTLLDTSGAGRRSFALALESAFGWDAEAHSISFAGATDLDVVARIAERRGCRLSPHQVEDFFARLPDTLRNALQREPPRVYPDVQALLENLSARDEVNLGLVTGNIESCAWVKLESCNLHGHFTLGAFGHEHGDRREIARLALHRAHQRLPPGRTYRACFLIGDTSSDIRAAHAIGATALAVATGSYDATSLREAGADAVLTSLEPTEHLLALLALSNQHQERERVNPYN